MAPVYTSNDWLIYGARAAKLSAYRLDQLVTEYRASLPERSLHLSAGSNRRGRVKDWLDEANPRRIGEPLDAFALGELLRECGIPGMSGFSALYVGGHLADYLAAIALVAEQNAPAAVDLLFATPFAVDRVSLDAAVAFERVPRYIKSIQRGSTGRLRGDACDLVAAAASTIDARSLSVLWKEWPKREQRAARNPAFSAALEATRFRIPDRDKERMAFAALLSWASEPRPSGAAFLRSLLPDDPWDTPRSARGLGMDWAAARKAQRVRARYAMLAEPEATSKARKRVREALLQRLFGLQPSRPILAAVTGAGL